jgi:hypothetical protein
MNTENLSQNTQHENETSLEMTSPTDLSSNAPARLALPVVNMLPASDGERARAILEDRVILYPALQKVVTEAEWMVHEPRQTRARGLIVCAERGNGKTSMAALIHRRYKDYERTGNPCALSVSMSGIRDARSLYGRIMEALGSPARISHRLSDRELLVQRLLRDAGCRLLILDEVQDILLGSEREQLRALEGIKLLMNELKVNILAFGTDKADGGFRTDSHLAARFSAFRMPAWVEDESLANFLATYERYLPLRQPSDLASPDKLKVLASVGGGVLGRIVSRIQNAALAAIADGSEAITKEHLVAATTRPAACFLKPEKKCA